ncbi:MAG: hypothetical protein AB7G75_15870 [Candidatus Binatia bacterium]
MINEKFLQLLNVLLEGTRAGKIKWHETVDEDAFRVVFGAGLVRIESRLDPVDETTFFVVSLLNRQGRTIETVTASLNMVTYPEPQVSYSFLSDLYTAARASARAADDVLDSILRDAEAGKTIDPSKE